MKAKAFYFMGYNPNNKSGFSWKIWVIQRRARKVTTSWGRAAIRYHRPYANSLQTKSWQFRTVELAKDAEQRRIREKLNEGYKRLLKSRN